jgi:hypothetical protein
MQTSNVRTDNPSPGSWRFTLATVIACSVFMASGLWGLIAGRRPR